MYACTLCVRLCKIVIDNILIIQDDENIMSGFTKLFSSIVASSIWCEDDQTRIVWVTMMAMANRDGVVEAAVPGLAHAARVSVEACRAALDKFEAPDVDSRSPEHDGRRIEKVLGGWKLLNYDFYRHRLSADDRREYNARKQAEYRAKKKEELEPREGLTHLKKGDFRKDDEAWLVALEADETYKGISIRMEFGKMKAWCAASKKVPSRLRFINWLNRVDRPVNGGSAVHLESTPPPALPGTQTDEVVLQSMAARLEEHRKSLL